MSKKLRVKTQSVQIEALRLIELDPGMNPSAILQKQFAISRQAVNYFLKTLSTEEKIHTEGYGKGTRYFPGSQAKMRSVEQGISFDKLKAAGEEAIFTATIEPFVREAVSTNLFGLIRQSSTKLLNNVIDHSHATHAFLRLSLTQNEFVLEIADDGIGAFESIFAHFQLADHYEAAGELAKGKRTTDPKHHSGDGIFLSSRMADAFHLEANGLSYLYNESIDDWTIRPGKRNKGTYLSLHFDRASEKTTQNVFDRYAAGLEPAWLSPRLVAPYVLNLPEGSFASRSEAKKLLVGAEDFQKVMINFQNVEEVGQGFADEMFRVWQSDHPHVQIDVSHANEFIQRMIRHVLR